jgi:hypothetical protein
MALYYNAFLRPARGDEQAVKILSTAAGAAALTAVTVDSVMAGTKCSTHEEEKS